MPMLRTASILGLIAAVLCATPVFALTKEEKMKTCKFGADDQKLTGKPRADFIKKCMADEAGPPKGATKPPAAQ
jgi:hypothetical protein